ncbi:hypothetical protein LAZ67_20002625 [Cordylochernes scorpioides]|uniref:Gag protein n=1 Tax=Cordylochernes scorpioides TaxID=51811 RepID=A0ABY6LPP2_9ARAC|nr:hypothetical protein LAZ67_20002625 [Cordylochernes scorpioides]
MDVLFWIDVWHIESSKDGQATVYMVRIIFDPASFYGHSEFDLSIASMFGGFSHDFFDAYHQLIPKEQGFENRQKLYELFHYLNHCDCLIEQLIKADREDEEIEDVDIVQANLFGRSEGVLQKMEQLLAKPTVDRESIVSGGNEGKSNLHRLPKLELPKFEGEAREWLQFWSAFQSVHDDDSISACVKFQYLQNCMIKGSVSEEIVSSFPNSAANYPLAISTLKERFGREDMLVEVYTVYVRLSSQLRALGSLEVTTDKCAAILYPMVESALPEDLFVAWERTRHHHKPDEDGKHKSSEVLLEKLMEFLKHEVEGRERMRLARQPFSSSYPSQFNRDKPPKPKTSVATAASLEVFGMAIDQNPGLNDLQKLQYLGSAVKGEAARLIRGFPVSSESYKQAWDTLVSRYDNQRELAYAQLNKIFKIKQTKNPSAKALRELLDTCNESVRNLGSLGLQRNELVGIILVQFLRNRIDEDMKRQWELTQDEKSFPSYENFILFLERQARSLPQGSREYQRKENEIQKDYANVHIAINTNAQICIACKAGHRIYNCTTFSTMPIEQKWEFVKQNKMCYNCLKKGHIRKVPHKCSSNGVLTTEIPNFKMAEPTWIMQRGFELTDPLFHISAPIDIILGADMYAYLMHGEKKCWEGTSL